MVVRSARVTTPGVYLLNGNFEFLYLFFEFHVLGTSITGLAIPNGAELLGSENLCIATAAQNFHVRSRCG